MIGNMLALILSLFLATSCVPVVDDTTVIPTPPPVVIEEGHTEDIVSGTWAGVFSTTEEVYFFFVVLELDVLEEGDISGTIEFRDEPLPTFGEVDGTLVELPNRYSFVSTTTAEGETLVLNFSGFIEEGVFTGTFTGFENTAGNVNMSKVASR